MRREAIPELLAACCGEFFLMVGSVLVLEYIDRIAPEARC